MTLLIFLIVLSILIFVHEAGHFWAARRAGIKVEEFGFGFPPRVWSKKVGETIYSINALPIGGFVRLYGEEEAPQKEQERSFYFKPKLVRALVVVAGVVMNFLLGFVLFSALYTAIGVPEPTDEVAIAAFTSGETPAEKAGLKVGDKIVAIEGEEVATVEQIQEKTKKFRGKPMEVTVQRSDLLFLFTGVFEVEDPEKLSLEVVPREEEEKGHLGVYLLPGLVRKATFYGPVLTPVRAVQAGVKDGIAFSGLIVSGVYNTVKDIVFKGEVPEDIAGPVGIFQITGEAARRGLLVLTSFVAVLSVNLAVLNIFPFPALDGGRLLFIGVESIFGRRVLPRFERFAHAVGMIILLLLLLLITIRDIGRFASGFKFLLPQ